MIGKVKDFINKERLLESGNKVVLGVSGGADSVCMLLVLKALAEELALELTVVHINHGLRGDDSDGDEAWVRQLCKKQNLPIRVFRPDVLAHAKESGTSFEESGRILRYYYFNKVCQEVGGHKIAVAHNKDDCSETILFNLFRGSGLKGLAGIPSKRGLIVRPLLCCSRAEIIEYLTSQGADYREDQTNFSNDYSRNRIRNQILPIAKAEINERAMENIVHAGEVIQSADQYFSELAERFYQKHSRQNEHGISISSQELCAEKPIVQSYILRFCLDVVSGSLKDITAGHIESLKELALKSTGKKLDLPNQVSAISQYGELIIRKNVPDGRKQMFSQMVFNKFPYVKGEEIPQNCYTKWFDCDKIQGTLVVRNRAEGDYITLPNGGRKTVKSFMIDQKIPKEQRDDIPLLADGKHILWIVGFRISEGFKVTAATKIILQAEYVGGKYNGRYD